MVRYIKMQNMKAIFLLTLSIFITLGLMVFDWLTTFWREVEFPRLLWASLIFISVYILVVSIYTFLLRGIKDVKIVKAIIIILMLSFPVIKSQHVVRCCSECLFEQYGDMPQTSYYNKISPLAISVIDIFTIPNYNKLCGDTPSFSMRMSEYSFDAFKSINESYKYFIHIFSVFSTSGFLILLFMYISEKLKKKTQ